MAPQHQHANDVFVLALQQAALSCLHLLQPPPDSTPHPHPATPESIASSCVDSAQIPVESSLWAEFARESFALPARDLLGAPLDENSAQNDVSSLPDCSESQWADLHSLDNLQSSGDVDYSWLDSLPPIEILDSTSEKLEFICDMPAIEYFDITSEKFESFSSTSTSSRSGTEECGPDIETTETHHLAQAQSAVRDASCGSIPLMDEEQRGEPSATSPDVSAPCRKKRRISDPSEPKYLIVTKSEEENLDDGFKWRKYGQKNVKDSIYPRSYYRCSYPGGCAALKQVQRSPLDHSLVWTTYKGRHAHHRPVVMKPLPPLPFDG